MGDKQKLIDSIDVERARVILAEVKAGGWLEGEIPDDEEQLVADAKYWYDEAYEIYQTGSRMEEVVAILNCGEGFTTEDEKKWGGATKIKNHGYSSGTPPRSSGGFSEQDIREGDYTSGPKDENLRGAVGATGVTGTMRIEPTVAEIHSLPVPKDWEGDLIDMPRDISEIADKEVRRISGAYNAYLARVKWLLALEISDLAAAAHLRDAAFRKSLKSVDKIDKESKKTKLKELIDAEAKESREWLNLDDLCKSHQKRVTEFKALQEIYSGNIDRLSREWTMRQDEYEKTR